MPRKRKSTTKRRKATTGKRTRVMRGKGIKEILSGVHKIVKDNKLISKGLGMIPSPYAQVAAQGASLLGYGRKRRKRATSGKRTMRGRGFFNDLGSGVGNVFGGLGGGIGSIAHGLFGNGRSRPGGMVPFIGSGRKRKSVIKL